ncbi:MAG: hypothetical protein JJU00_00590 [Opitutales bacterium]|nr:hypothetical protein [Opitutales bacterium]
MAPVVRILTVILAAAALAHGSPQAVSPERGDSRDKAIRVLGPPTGTAWMGDREVLQYPRGRIFLREGRVQTVDLMTIDAFLSRKAHEARREEKAAADADSRREEGEALRLATLADPDFRRLPADERLAFWRQFAADYPGISIEPTLYALSREIEREHRAAESPHRAAVPPDSWPRSPDIRRTGRYFSVPCPSFYPYAPRVWHRPPVYRRPAVTPEPDDSLRARIFRDFEANRRAAYSRTSP